MLTDLRYALRTLRRSPMFTLVAVLSLALGIGANTAIFRLMDAALLKSLPVRRPGDLLSIAPINQRGETGGFSYPLYRRIRDANSVFSGVYAASSGTSAKEWSGIGKVEVELVSAEYFSTLGVTALAGQLNGSGAVLSYRTWSAKMGRDLGAIGKEIMLDGHPIPTAGIAPSEFFGDVVGEAPDLWVPAEMQPVFDRGASMLEQPNTSWLRMMGRRRTDVTAAAAQAGMNLLLEQLKARSDPAGRNAQHYRQFLLSPGDRGFSELRARFSQPLRIVMGIVGLLLLIACANVANLLMARASARRREFAIRLALGAGRWRILRQSLAESLVLSCAGGVAGTMLASWGSRALLFLVSGGSAPVPLDLSLDSKVLAFTVAVSLVTGVVFGALPGWTSARLRGMKPSHLRPLVVLQVALSLLLITAAGLFVRTLRNLRAVNLGFGAEHVLQVRISPENSGYRGPQVLAVQQRIASRLQAIAGVAAAGMAGTGFRSGDSRTCCIAVEGHQTAAGEDRQIRVDSATPDYFSAMGMALVSGRNLTSEDVPSTRDALRTAVVNESFARYYFGAGNAVGKRFGWGDPPKVKYSIEIVGVVRDVIWGDLRERAPKMIYGAAFGGNVIAVRSAGEPAALIAAVRQAILAEDPGLRIYSMSTVAALKEQAVAQEKLVARLGGFFGIAALLLAGLGLFGVMSYGVVSRRKEIGIRMAIGARPAHVLGMVAREALLLVAAGAALGLAAVLACGRLVTSQLFGVPAADPFTIAIAFAFLIAVAAAAAWIPARRASLVDPNVVLRSD